MLPNNFKYFKSDVQLLPMLLGGQSFRWRCESEDYYVGVIGNSVWKLQQCDHEIHYSCHPEKENGEEILRKYLRLDVSLKPLYKSWCSDPHFKKASKSFFAVRMLDQDLIENMFSFICSSNNNIARISSMVEKMCRMYGSHIASLDGNDYYSFPDASSLSNPKVESELRAAGFGYRAKYIYQAAYKITEEGQAKWVRRLKSLDYPQAKAELKTLPGIGPKVADCICLMSLGHLNAIPVDTHVFQVASTHYLKHLSNKKTVTDKIYNEIGDHFRELFGPMAGWAHTILFCNDLKAFKEQNRKRKATSV